MREHSTFSTPTPQHKVHKQRRYLVDEKRCEICGETMHRPLDMEPWQFNRRATCSATCQAERRWRTRGRRQPFTETKTCTICGESYVRKCASAKQWTASTVCSHKCRTVAALRGRTIDRSTIPARSCSVCRSMFCCREDEEPGAFQKRKTCSQECAAALRGVRRRRWAKGESKPCEVCGVFFNPRPKEAPVHWEARQTCSNECHRILSGRNRRFGVTHSAYPPEWGEQRYRALERDQHCQFCGSVEKLCVHHINYDKNNCSLENLIVLCASCHSRTNRKDRRMWMRKCMDVLACRELKQAA